MKPDTALDILKSALLLERRGKAFYEKVAEQAEDEAVRAFFALMAREEEEHIAVLSEQYRAYQSHGAFSPRPDGLQPSADLSSSVLGQRLIQTISAAGFEAAAVAAALSMERSAIRVYAERAESAQDPEERELYRWLADWEAEHLAFLGRVDRELTESAWNDNRFWPL